MVAIVELLGPVQHGDVLSAQVVGHGQVALGLEYRHNVVTIHYPRNQSWCSAEANSLQGVVKSFILQVNNYRDRLG